MSGWSKDCTLQFIEKYRSYPCIWRIKSKDYHNRDMRESAYSDLLNFVKGFEPRATKDNVVKKINNLRSAFRKELKKVKSAQKSGMGADDVYSPKLWYFNELQFLIDQEESLDGASNLELSDQEELLNESEVADNAQSSQETTQQQQTPPPPSTQQTNRSSSVSGPSVRNEPAVSSSKPQFKRAKPMSATDQILMGVGKRLEEAKKEDQYDAFGKHVAQKLRAISPEQRVFAQKLINDALFEAELGCLYRNASINAGFPYNYQPPYDYGSSSSNTSSQNPDDQAFIQLRNYQA